MFFDMKCCGTNINVYHYISFHHLKKILFVSFSNFMLLIHINFQHEARKIILYLAKYCLKVAKKKTKRNRKKLLEGK